MRHNKPTFLFPDAPLYTQAVELLRRYHDAQASGLPEKEVEQLRLAAEYAFQTVTDYQLEALGRRSNVRH